MKLSKSEALMATVDNAHMTSRADDQLAIPARVLSSTQLALLAQRGEELTAAVGEKPPGTCETCRSRRYEEKWRANNPRQSTGRPGGRPRTCKCMTCPVCVRRVEAQRKRAEVRGEQYV